MSKRAAIALAGGALLALTPTVAQAAAGTGPGTQAGQPEAHASQQPQKPWDSTTRTQDQPSVTAKGATLVDGTNGRSLLGKTADTARPTASTAKMMTAAVVLDSKNLDLDRKVPVKQAYRDYVAEHSSSTADLQTGDKMTVRQLLYAALLPSGADAAYALADTYGTGDSRDQRVKSFVAQMNDKAAELGLKTAEFETFDGSGSDSASPNDLVKLAQHDMQNNTFRTVVKTQQYKGEAPAANGHTRYYTWNNTNQLLGSYKGVIGIKTGTTTPAGECLVFAAERDGKTLVGTVLNSKDRFKDAAKLLDYGFKAKTAPTMKLRTLPSDTQRD